MNSLSIVGQSAKTMSSREIAELIEKQHNHIKVSADRLASKGVIGTPATREFTHNGNTYTEYLLNKRDSLILVAQNCPEFTARIVDRWQELEAQAATPVELSRLDILQMAIESEKGRLLAVEQLAIAAPKADALDLLTLADGAMCITNAAKAVSKQPKALFSWLQANDWIYRRPGGVWCAYQQRIKSGLLTHKVTTVSRSDGTEKIVEQVLVTAKGLAKLAEVAA